MQDILDEPIVIPDLIIEIRSRHPGVSTSSTDLQGRCLEPVEQSRLLLVCGCPAPPGPEQLAVLADPLIEDVILVPAQGAAPATGWRDAIYVRENAVDAQEGTERHFLDVFCRPGVTDAEGDMAAQALEQTGMAGVSCRAGTRYHFSAAIPMRHRTAIQGRLGNPLIHRFLWSDDVAGRSDFMHGHAAPPAAPVRVVSLTGLGEPALLDISREEGLALDLAEMQAIQSHFAEIGRDPTDVELQSLALTWSEHCSHKTFKATIHLDHAGSQETIDGLLAECIAAPTRALDKPWVHSVFDDNAGIIAFDDDFDLAFKVETHNHPSALEPYGGAHTGVGGVIRDVLAVSAEPIANTDVLCFGPLDLDEAAIPAGALHPRATLRGVVDGIGDYGNNMGIPTVGGAVLFHRRYTANPLVYCGTLGILPAGSHSVGPRPGDAVVLLGGRTGRDGLHGATMSSETLDRESVSTSTVQIGAPITEKVVRDALPQLRDERLYHAITDCGAGGLCSAVGEMGAKLGVEVDLALVPLKYQGLSPWEIWLSEAQERMVLAVPAVNLFRLHQICRAHDVEATVLGRFRDDGMLRLVHGSDTVAELALGFMHGGRPHRTLCARWAPSPESSGVGAAASGFVNSPVGAAPSGHPLGPG
ncbi:MAG TPA: AIR synthase-related protein, partial [Chloroflexota bacterium]